MKKILFAFTLFTSIKILGSGFESPFYEEDMKQFESPFYEQGMQSKDLNLIKKAAFHGDVRALFQLNDLRTCLSFDPKFKFVDFGSEFCDLIRLSKSYFSTQIVLFPMMFGQFFSIGSRSLEKDLVKSFFWAKKAATLCDQNSDKVAQEMSVTHASPALLYFNLGVFYNQGIGVVPNYLEAAKVFEKSAELGYSQAIQDLLIVISNHPYIFQEEVRIQKLKKWHKISGNGEDLFNVAILKKMHPETDQEYQEGVKYLKKLAKKGNIPAQFELAEIGNDDQKMHLIAQKSNTLTPVQKVRLGILMMNQKFGFDEAYGKQAYDLFQEAQLNEISCDQCLGYCYEKGIGVDQNYDTAAAYYQQNIENPKDFIENKIMSYTDLGFLHMHQHITNWDYRQAHDLFDVAIEHNDTTAMYNKAYMINHALGCERNIDEALRLYKIAADAGDIDAQYNLGLIYKELEQYDQAHLYYGKAANQDCLKAINDRIYLFLNGHKAGDQTPENVKEALLKNARAGSPESQITLASLFLGGYEELGICQSQQDARKTLEGLLSREDLSNRHKMLTTVLLYHLENQEDLEEVQGQVSQNISEPLAVIEESTVPQVATAKPSVTKEFLRKRKETRDIERALKRKETFDQLKARQQEEESHDLSTQEDHFTDQEIAILEEFASHKGAMKEREFSHILKLLGAKSTKSGYVIKRGAKTVGGHRPHNRDIVEKGAVKGVQHYVRENIISGEKR